MACLALLVYINYQSNGKKLSTKNPPDRLVLGEIAIEIAQNSNTPIWVVSGKVFNNSPHLLHVPPISLRSGVKGSSGYFDWIYQPALQMLAPGASFRFRTSVRKPVGSANGVKLEFIAAKQSSG